FESGEVVNVGAHDAQPPVAQMLLVVPGLAGGEVVVDRDPADAITGQQPVDEVAADEPRAAGDEETLAHREYPICLVCRGGKFSTCRWKKASWKLAATFVSRLPPTSSPASSAPGG